MQRGACKRKLEEAALVRSSQILIAPRKETMVFLSVVPSWCAEAEHTVAAVGPDIAASSFFPHGTGLRQVAGKALYRGGPHYHGP